MTTLNAIAQEALKTGGDASENQVPSAYKVERVVKALSDFLVSLPLRGVGGTLREVTVDESVTVDTPSRLAVNTSAALTITLPPTPKDGYYIEILDVGANFATYNVTVARNGRLIDGAASDATLSTNGQSKRYFYRADLGSWQTWATSYAGTDTVPLPVEFEGGLQLIALVQASGALGIDFNDSSRSWIPLAADKATRHMSARYANPRRLRVDRGLTGMPSQKLSWGNTTVRLR